MNKIIQELPQKGLVKSVLFWWIEKRIKEIEKFSFLAAEIQENQRIRLIEFAKETEYGKKHHFSQIKSYSDFTKQIPIVTYEEFEPYIQLCLQGETNIIWPKKINWFAKSSGTTNAKSKFIPITTESLDYCHYKGGKDMFALYANNYPDTKIFDCLNLRLGGSAEINDLHNYSVGDLSAILIQNLPFWAEIKNIPNKKTSLIASFEEKLPAIINEVLHQNVGSFTGVPSWMYVLLSKVLEASNKKHLDELWQNVEVFFHGGISFSPYKESYNQLFSKPINYSEIYNASEGFFALQDTKANENGLLLMLDYGIFYEFIPMDNFKLENAIPLWEVELNKNYAMVITTNGGLWRYLIGDTVKFVSKNPYRIIISGRTQLFINVFGEELMIDNTDKAIKIASEKTHAVVLDYTVAPKFMEKNQNGTHEWLIEFEKKPENLNQFIEILDQTLKSINSDYEAKRLNNITLGVPIVHLARKNLFYDWLKSKNKLGGQNKVPRLSNERKYLDELLEINTI